jgi:hypothetical protein
MPSAVITRETLPTGAKVFLTDGPHLVRAFVITDRGNTLTVEADANILGLGNRRVQRTIKAKHLHTDRRARHLADCTSCDDRAHGPIPTFPLVTV